MSLSLALLIAAVLLFASLLVTHVVLLSHVFRSELPTGWKAASLVPVLTPAVAWRANRRRTTILWAVLLATYLLVRLVGG